MKIVYAIATTVIGQALITHGSHWPADDPIVAANPGTFSDDPRYGLQYSVEPVEFRDPAPVREKRSYIRHLAGE